MLGKNKFFNIWFLILRYFHPVTFLKKINLIKNIKSLLKAKFLFNKY